MPDRMSDLYKTFVDRTAYDQRHSELMQRIQQVEIRLEQHIVEANKAMYNSQQQLNEMSASFGAENMASERRLTAKIEEQFKTLKSDSQVSTGQRIMMVLGIGGWLLTVAIEIMNRLAGH